MLCATRHVRAPLENFIGGDPHDGPMPMDYFVWVAVGPGGAYRDRYRLHGRDGQGDAKRTFLRCPIDSLALLGVEAGAVRDVILTHMHYDHVGNFHKFPNARFHLQEREMAYATGKYMRYPRPGHSFHVEDVVGMVRLNFKGRVEMHAGEVEIAPGITLHPTYGHSDGLQCRCACTPSAAGWCWPPTPPTSTRTCATQPAVLDRLPHRPDARCLPHAGAAGADAAPHRARATTPTS